MKVVTEQLSQPFGWNSGGKLFRQHPCLLTNNFPERNIHCFRGGEHLGDIELQDNDIRPLRITARAFAACALREILFVPVCFPADLIFFIKLAFSSAGASCADCVRKLSRAGDVTV
jgi:hypothetical protein